MNEKNILTTRVLTYAGIIPFLFLGMAVVFRASGLDYRFALLAYGAVIISFLAGIHWAVFLFFSQKCARNLLLHSNGLTLLGWLSVLPDTPHLSCSLQIAVFIYLLLLDRELYRNKIIPSWFFQLRLQVTVIVVLLLAITVLYS